MAISMQSRPEHELRRPFRGRQVRHEQAACGQAACGQTPCQPFQHRHAVPRARRRRLLASLCGAALLSLTMAPPQALANDWPAKPVALVVPFPPGGPTDSASRIVGEKLAQLLGQPVIVENRSGASGSIAAAQVARAPADGYTLMMLATPTLLAPHLYKGAKYDINKDFTAVGTVYDLPLVLVINPTVLPGVGNVQELIAKAKAAKPPLNFTTSGHGSFGHLTTEKLKDLGQFDMQHIAYRGGVAAVTDLVGGQVPIMFADMVAALPHIRSGRLKALAVSSPERVPFLPDVKTLAEQGFEGFEAVSWGGLVAPAKLPAPVVERVSRALKEALADEAVRARLETAGTFAHWESPADTAGRIRSDDEVWGAVIRDKGVTGE